MKVLIATDGSKDSDAALLAACQMLQPKDREVDVACVAPAFAEHGSGEDRVRLRDSYRRRIVPAANVILERSKELLEKAGVDAGAIAEVGSPAEVIIRLSENYDLTVIGAKGRGTQPSVGLGPVASRVAEAAHPLLIGRPMKSESGFRVLIAVDGSAASSRALDVLAGGFDLASADVMLMHVIEMPWVHLGLEDEWFEEDDVHEDTDAELRWQREVRMHGDMLLEAARSRLLPAHAAVEVMIAEGMPANEILSELDSDDYDLVVLGATGTADLKHTLLGSVSMKVAWQAPCSVLLVQASDS